MDTKKLVEKSVEYNKRIFSEPNLDFADEYVSKDHQFHDSTAPDLPPGIETSKAFLEQIREAFPNLKMTVTNAFGQDDKVVYQWSAEGKHEGPWLGHPPTGKSAKVEGATVERYGDDELIAESWNYWDALSLMTQLGISAEETEQPSAEAEQRPGIQ